MPNPSIKAQTAARVLTAYIEASWSCGQSYATRVALGLGIPDTTECEVDHKDRRPNHFCNVPNGFALIDKPISVYYHGPTMNLVFVNENGLLVGIKLVCLLHQHALFDELFEKLKNANSC